MAISGFFFILLPQLFYLSSAAKAQPFPLEALEGPGGNLLASTTPLCLILQPSHLGTFCSQSCRGDSHGSPSSQDTSFRSWYPCHYHVYQHSNTVLCTYSVCLLDYFGCLCTQLVSDISFFQQYLYLFSCKSWPCFLVMVEEATSSASHW